MITGFFLFRDIQSQINFLPYIGAGSGITRALKFTPDIMFVNDGTLNEFVVIVERKNVEDNVEVDDRDNDGVDRDKNVEVDVEDGGEVGQRKYMVSHIKPLIEMGYLELIIPD